MKLQALLKIAATLDYYEFVELLDSVNFLDHRIMGASNKMRNWDSEEDYEFCYLGESVYQRSGCKVRSVKVTWKGGNITIRYHKGSDPLGRMVFNRFENTGLENEMKFF